MPSDIRTRIVVRILPWQWSGQSLWTTSDNFGQPCSVGQRLRTTCSNLSYGFNLTSRILAGTLRIRATRRSRNVAHQGNSPMTPPSHPLVLENHDLGHSIVVRFRSHGIMLDCQYCEALREDLFRLAKGLGERNLVL